MLGAFIKKENCAACRFCCSFRRKSLWEVPKFPASFADNHATGFDGRKIKYRSEEKDGCRWVITDLSDCYVTDDPEEEAACPFLDPENGCILSAEQKPFECRAWPLRYMRIPDGSVKVCLTPTCPATNAADREVLHKYAVEKWEHEFESYAKEHPYIIKDYIEGFIIL